MSECAECGRALGKIDEGATKKFINRGAERFFCVGCLAEHFKVDKEVLYRKIEEFKENGCSLF